MAANNLVSYDLKGVKESFANWVSNISPQDTPFVSLTGKEAVKNKYFQWQTDALKSAGNNAFIEGEDATDGSMRVTEVLKNVTQILRKVVKVSDTADALSSYGRGSELQYQMEKASKEIKRDLEWTFLNQINGADIAAPGTSNIPTMGVAYTLGEDVDGNDLLGAPTLDASNKEVTAAGARKTKGFAGLVAPLAALSPEGAGSDVHRNVATAGTIVEADLFGTTEALYLAGAKASHIMFHPKHAKFFSSLRENSQGSRKLMFDGAVAQKINAYVSCIVDPLGQEFCLLPNRYMPLDKIYVFSPSDWTQMVLREPTRVALAKNGSYERWMIEMEVGLRHKNPFASGVLEIGTAAVVAPTITTKGPITGKVGGSTTTFNAMFDATGSVAGDYTFVVTPTAAGTVDATTGVLTLANTASGTVTVKATHSVTSSVTATTSFTGVTPKLTSLTATAGTGGTLTAGTLTIADHTTPAAGVDLTIAGVPTGAVIGTLTTSKAGTDAAKVTATVAGNKVTILASDVIASTDTKVTITSSVAGATPLVITVKATA